MVAGQDDFKSFGKCYDQSCRQTFLWHSSGTFLSRGADCLVLIREVKSEYTSNLNSVNC